MTDDDTARRCINKMLAEDKYSAWLGIRLLDVGIGRAQTTLTIIDSMVNGHRICHGGVLFSLADTTFACACNGHNRVTVAQGCDIEFLRPALLGDTLIATGIEKKRGKQTGVCDIEIFNQHEKPVTLFRGKSFITAQAIL